MKFVTIGMALAWICERDETVVRELMTFPDAGQMALVFQRYAQRYAVRIRRRNVDRPDELTNEPAMPVGLISAPQALEGLKFAMREGVVGVIAQEINQARAQTVSIAELQYLELRLGNESQAGVCGFWHPAANRFMWLNPLISLEDLVRLWPAPFVPGREKAATRILEALVSTNGAIKKDAALGIAEKVEGYTRRRFEDAWRLFPKNRKFGVGQRGPARH